MVVATAAGSATATAPPLATADTCDDPAASALFFGATLIIDGKAPLNPAFACLNETRSCGRLGPARLGSTVARSSSIVSEYTGSGSPGRRNMPCAFAYASTS